MRQFEGEQIEIAFEKQGRVLRRHRNLLFAQDLVHDPDIGSPRDLDSLEIIGHAELLPEHILQRLKPGTAGINQRSIDVEEEEALWD